MTRIFTCLLLTICLVGSAFAQSGSRDEKNQKILEEAARKGKLLSTDITVKTNVTAVAVLIPRVDVNRIFGKEIAENYAVIQLIVANKSSDAALIIHGIFIDYTGWALSGTTSSSHATTVEGLQREREAQFQASTNPNHIASEEYRVVRGQLLDAQMWTKRNWTMRALTFIGSLAGASVFSFKEKGPLNTISAFNSIFVPNAQTLWPDNTVAQLNRVSDFGYQTNKVVPQQGSEVIVCFFPIDRFLTPGFRRLFLKSPALFFAPLQMLLDKTIEADVNAVLGTNLGLGNSILGEGEDPLSMLRKNLPCYLRIEKQQREGRFFAAVNPIGSSDEWETKVADLMSQAKEDICLDDLGFTKNDKGVIVTKPGSTATDPDRRAFLLLDYISQMSLNNVKVVVDGVMTVDTTAIAAKIHEIEFDSVANCGDDKTLCFWTDMEAGKGIRSGTLHGSYLTGGKVEIAEAEALELTEVKTIAEGSSDQLLHFSFKLTKPIASGTKLHFIVTKPLPGTPADAKDPKTKDSLEWEYVVGYTYVGPTIDKVEFDAENSTLTITGAKFLNSADRPLVVVLHSPGGKTVEKKASADEVDVKSEKLVLPIEDITEVGCWSVEVKVGGLLAQEFPPPTTDRKTSFTILPSPALETAKVNEETIVVTGTGFTVAKKCDKDPLVTFHLVKGGDTQSEGKALTIVDDSDLPTKVTLHLPAKAKKQPGPWKIRVMVDGKEVSGINPVNLEGVKPLSKRPN